MRFFELARGATPGDRTAGGFFDRRELPFLLRVLHALPHRGVTTCLRRGRDAGGDRIKIDVGTRREQSLFIEDRNRLETPFPEGTFALVFFVRQA